MDVISISPGLTVVQSLFRHVDISFHKRRLLHFGDCVQALGEKGIQRRYGSGVRLTPEDKC